MEERRTSELEEALGNYAHLPDLVAGLRHALGSDDPELPLDPAMFPVTAFLLRPGQDLFVAWFLTPGRFVVHETSPAGDTLSVAVPLSRVSRVSESDVAGTLTVSVELDADAVSWRLRPIAEGGLEGRADPARYVLAVSDAPTRMVAYRFASAVRRALGA